MHWARIVAGIHCILVVIFVLTNIGTVNVSVDISSSTSFARTRVFAETSTPASRSSSSPGSDGTVIATMFFMLIGAFGFPSAILCFNKVDHTEDSHILKPVMILFRITYGLQTLFWAAAAAYAFILSQGSVISIFSGTVCIITGLLGCVVGLFGFKGVVVERRTEATNRRSVFSLICASLGFVLIVAGLFINVTSSNSNIVFWNALLQSLALACFVVLFPLFLMFKNNAGEFTKPNLVFTLICIICCFLSIIVWFGTYIALTLILAVLGSGINAISVYVALVGYTFMLVSLVVSFVTTISLRVKFANQEYSKLTEEQASAPPVYAPYSNNSAPPSTVGANAPPGSSIPQYQFPPQYQQAPPQVSGPPSYQEQPEGFNKPAPQEEGIAMGGSQAGGPASYRSNPSNDQAEFDYDKPLPGSNE